MKNKNYTHNFIRPMLRAIVLAAVFVGPFAGFAVAAANDNGNNLQGAGFVLYMAMIR